VIFFQSPTQGDSGLTPFRSSCPDELATRQGTRGEESDLTVKGGLGPPKGELRLSTKGHYSSHCKHSIQQGSVQPAKRQSALTSHSKEAYLNNDAMRIAVSAACPALAIVSDMS
jgi:hypothetical protein